MGITAVAAGQRLTAAMINSLPVVVSYLSTGSVSNSTAETVIGTFTIPANDPQFPGGYRMNIFGTVTEAASPTVSIRVKLNSTGGTTLLSLTGATVSATPAYFGITGFLGFSSIGSTATFGSDLKINQNFNGSSVIGGGIAGAVAINTTNSNTIIVTAQFGTANASNTATTTFGAMYRE